MIPNIIHQIWFQGQDHLESPRYLHFQSLWIKHHPGWDYKLWDDRSIATLVQRYYPDFYELYDSYPLMIQKIDAAKYFILEHYGGFYADIDIECKRSLEPLAKYELVLGQIFMTPLDIFLFTFNQIKRGPFINNASMASVPHHPFWQHITAHLGEYSLKRCYYTKEYYVSASTGPQFLTRMVQDYNFGRNDKVLLAPPEYFEPYSLGKEGAMAAATRSFGVHMQDNTWLTWFYRSLKQVRYGHRDGAGRAETKAPLALEPLRARENQRPAD